MSKKTLDLAVMDGQAAMELPERQLMLVTVIISNVLNNLRIDVDVTDNNVAVQVCAIVRVLNTILVGDSLRCKIVQS
jgi:hypothetical protein